MTDTELLAAYIGLLPRSRAATATDYSEADLAALQEQGIPRLPRLYEQLLRTWAWDRAEAFAHELSLSFPGWNRPLQYTILGNPVGKGPFGPLVRQMKRDPVLWNTLRPTLLIPFAQGGFQAYDPICFDLRRGNRDDCPIVSVDHEEILCNDRIQTRDLAPSFRDLLVRTRKVISRTADGSVPEHIGGRDDGK